MKKISTAIQIVEREGEDRLLCSSVISKPDVRCGVETVLGRRNE